MMGRSESNKIIHFVSEKSCIGDLVNIKIKKAHINSLWGEKIK